MTHIPRFRVNGLQAEEPGPRRLVVTDFLDQLVFCQARIAGQAKLFGALLEFGNRPILIRAGLAACLAPAGAAASRSGVGDPSGLFLGVSLFAKILVKLLIF